jgi:hypothetical protein
VTDADVNDDHVPEDEFAASLRRMSQVCVEVVLERNGAVSPRRRFESRPFENGLPAPLDGQP